MTLQQIFEWLGTPGAMGILISVLFENVTFFQNLPSKGKAWAIIVVTLLLGFASALLTGHAAGAELFIALVTSVASSQAWHRYVNVGDGLSAKWITVKAEDSNGKG